MGEHDLAVFGDWHMQSAWATHMIAEVAVTTGGRDWYHVGDFGMWSTQPHSEGRAYLDAVESALASVGATLHVMLGNHANYDLRDDFVPAESGWLSYPDGTVFASHPEHMCGPTRTPMCRWRRSAAREASTWRGGDWAVIGGCKNRSPKPTSRPSGAPTCR